MTKIVGLTGGIGSGKSTVAAFFREWGVPVYIADEEAKKLMSDPEVIQTIQKLFNEKVVENGLLNRKKIADLVFSNPAALKKLNAIIHPKVQEHFHHWVNKHKQFPFVIKEAAILFESGSYKDCDKIILVTAPESIRLQRVQQRDSISKDQILERMNNQWPDETKKTRSNYIIDNINLEETRSKSKEILKELRNM